MSKQLLYPKRDLDTKIGIVVFNSEWVLPGKKQPDPETALRSLREKRRGFDGLPAVEQKVDEVIRELAESTAGEDNNYNPQIKKLEIARQSILADSIYKKRLEELKRTMNIFGAGMVTSSFVLLWMGLGIKLKRQNALEELKKKRKHKH